MFARGCASVARELRLVELRDVCAETLLIMPLRGLIRNARSTETSAKEVLLKRTTSTRERDRVEVMGRTATSTEVGGCDSHAAVRLSCVATFV